MFKANFKKFPLIWCYLLFNFFSVNSIRNFIFSFCAVGNSFIKSLMLITEKTGLKIFYNYLKTKIHIFKNSTIVNNFICTSQLHCISL